MRAAFMIIVLLFLASGASAFAECSTESFESSCACVKSGREGCWDSGKSMGIGCMGTSYPMATTKYWMGDCPPLDKCVKSLEACVQAYCKGSDADKCASAECRSCHIKADYCASKAASCTECGDGSCDTDTGENQDTCCIDCKCPEDLECRPRLVRQSTCVNPDAVCLNMCLGFLHLPIIAAASAVFLASRVI